MRKQRKTFAAENSEMVVSGLMTSCVSSKKSQFQTNGSPELTRLNLLIAFQAIYNYTLKKIIFPDRCVRNIKQI